MIDINSIISNLKAHYIVVIENEFYYEEDIKIILSKYCVSISERGRMNIGKDLTSADANVFAGMLESFRTLFLGAADHNEELLANLLPEELTEYLTQINASHIFPVEFQEKITEFIEGDSGHVIKEVLLRHGIYKTGTNRYDAILSKLSENENVEFAFYRTMPVPVEIEAFESNLLQGIERTDSNFYIAIVDKMLGEGNEETGRAFIDQELLRINVRRDLKGLIFLFTSQANDRSLSSFESYFVRELAKGDVNIIEKIAACLTDCSYATVFKSLELDYQKASSDALKLAINNQQNVKHIIGESINEGISVYDSIKNWFELLIKLKIENLNIQAVKYHTGLTQFFDDQNLQDNDGLSNYGPELEKLNSFELFDNNVNRKALPIQPGDIFEIAGEFYILTGQVCDILLRKTGTRGSKIAEFLKIKLKAFNEKDEGKFIINVNDNGTKDVIIQHFFDTKENSYKVASLEITSKNMYYGDYEVLDLCYFNSNGKACLDLDFTEDQAMHVLTNDKKEYHSTLVEFFKNVHDYKVSKFSDIEAGSSYIVSNGRFEITDRKLNFNASRISRLKGRFYDSLQQQINNYKARIDLNLIDNSIATTTNINLTIRFKFTTIQEIVECPLVKIKGQKPYIETNALKPILSVVFHSAIEEIEIIKEGKGGKDNDYSLEIINDDPTQYLLELFLKYTESSKKEKVVVKDTLKFKRLFGEDITNPTIEYTDNSEQSEVQDGEILISDIQRGIRLFQNDKRLNIVNGKIVIE